MKQFSYRIDTDFFKEYPYYCRGVVVFNGLNNARPSSALSALLRECEAGLRQRIQGNVAEYPHVAAWREAYRQFGAKPSEHRSSIEALSRRVLKPDSLPEINPLVDIGNLLSLRYVLPAGVHPIGEQSRDIVLRQAVEGDLFLAEHGQAPEGCAPREIVLTAGNRVLTRRWTWRQAADTRTLPGTDCVFYDIDGLPPVTPSDVHAAIDDLLELVARFCGGSCIGYAVLCAERPELVLPLD